MLRMLKRCAALMLLSALMLGGLPRASAKTVEEWLEGFETGETWFGEDFAYDITDEEACWELLQRPITVLDVSEKELVYPRVSPNGEKVVNEWMGGSINGSLAAVHVLGEDEDGWTLIEGMDYYDRVIRGYVKTSLLKTVTPNDKYGIIIDKLTQRLYMFIDGKLWSSCAVSTGLPNKDQPYNETAAGEYLIGSWVGGFDSEGMYCEMGIRFNGGDLLHQVPYVEFADGTKDFSKYGSQLGRKASHGCVRVTRTANDEGLCISWLWENLKKNTKVVVWDDDGRTLPYPDDDLEVYYNPDGGTSYHATATCRSVRDKYLPLTAFTYGELDSGKYASLTGCTNCIPVKRRAEIDEINQVVKQYDNKGMLIGEAPCTKDLIDITDRDFKVVSAISILAILLIIAFVLRSVSLPIILVAVIELAIFINMGIPYFTGTELPFIASICIGTIQLGSTVDYAILMTTRYKRERFFGNDKRTSVRIAHSTSMPSIMVSALGFFAATFGVAIYSDIDIISSLCTLMARGAVISMLVVMFILPSMFMLFDKLICKTSKGFINKDGNGNTGGKGAIPPIMDTAE